MVERGEKYKQRFDFEDHLTYSADLKQVLNTSQQSFHSPVVNWPFHLHFLSMNIISQIFTSSCPPCLLFHGENRNRQKENFHILQLLNLSICLQLCPHPCLSSHRNGCAPPFLLDSCVSFLVLSHWPRDFAPTIIPLSLAPSIFPL